MIAHHTELRHTVVYGRSGDAMVERVQVANPPDVPSTDLSPAETRVRNIMSNDLICAYEDLEVRALTALIVRHRIGCVPIVDRLGRAVGMVTKSDLVDHLETLPRAGKRVATLARDIMMPVPMVLPESATPREAATMMILEDIHHVLVASDAGFLVGIVSAKDLVHWMVDNR
jgi:CBS-domain-containing membrane protein